MDRIGGIMGSLNTGHWLTIIGIVVAIILWSANHYLTARRERKKTEEPTPAVQATINRDSYPHGWRSVQLHIMPQDEQRNFQFENWCIKRARLLRPWWGAVLARAENDDYATRVFYPENPVRTLEGKSEGRPQRFALEFFIKFDGNDRGRKAKFKVSFAHAKKNRRHTTDVWATVPVDAL
jgi:hypothetical protein